MPVKCIINESKFIADPEVGHLVEKHADFFNSNEHPEHLKLTFFVMHEISKGERSFWHHYFKVCPTPDMPCFWSEEELNELHDPMMKQEAENEAEELQEEYEEILEIA